MGVRVQLFTDFVCPFCFIAERSSVVRLQREFDVDIDWIGYELHPDTPRGGLPLSSYLPDAEAMLGYVKAFAARFGIDDLSPPERLANTRRALAVAQYARDEGRLDAFRAAAFDAYWRLGLGLESDEDIARLAERAGLDPQAAVAAARDPNLLAVVDAARRQAVESGVTSVPTFEVRPALPGEARAARVVGCQRYDVLAEAVRRAGARRRGSASPMPG
jgi:predicted DsbA family dithiol-disulfide isomerase